MVLPVVDDFVYMWIVRKITSFDEYRICETEMRHPPCGNSAFDLDRVNQNHKHDFGFNFFNERAITVIRRPHAVVAGLAVGGFGLTHKDS